ncbi:unnamed protein product [Camellia sinensis]
MVRVSRVLLGVRDGGFGISKSLLEILVCPLSKQPLRMCEQSNSLISDAIGVAYPIANGIPCLVPKDGKIIDTDDMPKPAGIVEGDFTLVTAAAPTQRMRCTLVLVPILFLSGKALCVLIKMRDWRIEKLGSVLMLVPFCVKEIEEADKLTVICFCRPMVIKKFISSISTLIGLKGLQRIKHRLPCEAIAFNIGGVVKEGANDSRLGQTALDGEMCCVCLLTLEEGEDRRVLPCRHEFHRACVNRWLNGCQKTCPVCRFLVEDEEKSRVKEALTDEMVIWFSSFHVAGF